MTEEPINLEQERQVRRGSSNGDGPLFEIGQRLTRVETKIEGLEVRLEEMPTKDGMESAIKSVKLWVLGGIILTFVLAAGFGLGIAELLVGFEPQVK